MNIKIILQLAETAERMSLHIGSSENDVER